jgi:hypothetical protein
MGPGSRGACHRARVRAARGLGRDDRDSAISILKEPIAVGRVDYRALRFDVSRAKSTGSSRGYGNAGFRTEKR